MRQPLTAISVVYPCRQLLDGWGGPQVSSTLLSNQTQMLMLFVCSFRIITNQILFDVLDGVPIVLAMVTLNVFHPGRLIPTITPRLEPQFAMT